MSSSEKPFKVLIACGVIAGLALAHMLEKFHIDYLLLEAHSEIDPNIGASIGIGPHGVRILDQFDLYEPIAELNYKDKRGNHIHNENGDCLLNVFRFHRHVEIRHGYPIVFIDRQFFLRVHYDQLRNKNCALLNKIVDRVELLQEGVEVFTTDGQSVRGSLLIGANGVHSATRREMYQIASEQAPEYFAADEQEPVSCHYICNFGIALDVPGWEHGHTYTITGKGHSQLVVPGPENRIYWLFFEKLSEKKYGKDVPRCIQEMEEEFIRKYEHAPITKTLTFGQLYANRLFTTVTPLHEYVCFQYSEMGHLSTTLSGAVLQSYWNSKPETIDQTAEAFSSGMAFVTWFISKVYSIWDLRRFGYIKTRDGLICASSVVAGQVLFGPGATWAGLWYWREGVIVGLQRN